METPATPADASNRVRRVPVRHNSGHFYIVLGAQNGLNVTLHRVPTERGSVSGSPMRQSQASQGVRNTVCEEKHKLDTIFVAIPDMETVE
jgi:hypothetical protein